MAGETISKDNIIPLYYQLELILRERIQSGVYKNNEKIPNEKSLCAEFGVSRITVRKSVENLVGAGLLEKRPPKGTYVKSATKTERKKPVAVETHDCKQLTLMIPTPMLDYSFYQAIQEFETNTGVEVIIKQSGWWNISGVELYASLLKRDIPDVFLAGSVEVRYFAQKGAILDMDSFVPQDELAALKSFEKENRYGQYLWNDKLYGYPFFAETRLMYYRRDHFLDCGLDCPSENWTHDDFLAICKELIARGATQNAFAYPINSSADTLHTIMPWIIQRGGSIFEKCGDKTLVKTSDDAFIDAFSWYCDLIRRHKVCSFVTKNTSYTDLVSKFLKGELSMFIGLPSLGANLLERQEFDGKWGIVSLPHGKNGNKCYMGRMPWCISQQCKNPDMAWRLIAHLSSRNVLFPYTKRVGVLLPPQRFDSKDIMLNTHPMLRIFVSEQYNVVPWDIDTPNPYVSVAMEDWQPSIQHALCRAVTEQLTNTEACKYATMSIQDLIDT